MRNSGFTKQERSFRALMRIWMVVFFFTAILFAVAPDYIPDYITKISEGLFNLKLAPLQFGNERFWLVLAVSLLFSLSYMCAIVQKSPVQNIGYTRPVLLSKLASSIGFIICFFASGHHPLYAVGAVVDGSIFLITLQFYRMAIHSRN